MPLLSRSSRTPIRSAAAVLLGCLLAAIPLRLLDPPPPAAAAVEHGSGFRATVDGYTSWFGGYRLGPLGDVWCIDHGIAAPDVALGYEPTMLDGHAPETQRAMAWAVGTFGPAAGSDPVDAAALMLVLHDLMGARYPSGPLDVDALDPRRLAGFDGNEAAVVERARAMKATAVNRAALVAPLRLDVRADPVPAGRRGVLEATLRDATGAPVAGVVVHPAVTGAALADRVDAPTDADGTVRWRFDAAPGENRFELRAAVPGVELVALQPTAGRAQRVARPSSITVAGGFAYEAEVPRRFTIHKRGDAEPALPVGGARFAVSGVEGELIVGAEGRTAPIELLPGRYTVTEVSPPPGYEAAGPWTIDVTDADVTLEVSNRARRGRLRIDKVDAVTGAPVAGAAFAVAADRDGDPATFETPIPHPHDALLPGRYEVREVVAPPGYRLAIDPVVVVVPAGVEAVAVVADVPFATASFVKRPPLAGATFAVRSESGDEAGRCTTGGDGTCALATEALDGGRRYCWEEVVAPVGWGLAPGSCFLTGGAGSTTTIVVDEPPLPPPPAPPTAPDVSALPTAEAAPAPRPPEPPPAQPSSPPAPPEQAPVAPPVPGRAAPAIELPRTGANLGRLAVAGALLVAGGALLVGRPPLSPGASSSGTRGRRAPRRPQPARGAGRCRP